MNDPERDLNPPEETLLNEPDPSELRVYEIEDRVLQAGLLPERILVALAAYHNDNADIDYLVLLLEECLEGFEREASAMKTIALLADGIEKQTNILKQNLLRQA